MGKQHEHKTNAMRVLDAAGIPYTSRLFPCETALSGVEVARLLELDPARVFKTLVCVGKSGEHHVFMVPVAQELDLRKAACAVGEKSVHMVKSRELLPSRDTCTGDARPSA